MVSAVRRLLAGLSISAVFAAGVALAGPVSAAQAGVIDLNACNLAPLSQPFAGWLDPAWYELAPGGDFEAPTWRLGGGAARIPGSDPFAATGARGAWSLSLPAGASAESPPTCVDAGYPTIRFFIAGTGVIAVSVVYGDLAIPAGVAVATGGWLPAPMMLTGSALVAATSDGSAQVSLRLTALSGDPRVDDVFVDPWNRG